MTIVMALVAALGVFLVFMALVGARAPDAVQARLTQLGSMQARTLEELELQQPFFERSIRPLAVRLSGVGQRFTSTKKQSRTEQRLAMAGNPGDLRTSDFLGLKVVVAGAVAGVVILVLGLVAGDFAFGMLAGSALGVIGFFMPDFWVSRRIKKRQKLILLAIPDSLDLLTISVKAGLGFDAALTKVVEKTKSPVADEFQRALAEIRVGKARRDALRDVVARTNVPALSSFIGAIIQAEQLGVSISKVLQVQSEQLRIERRQRAEEMAAKAPIKMLFPLVGCIFPSMIIVILGPAIILIASNMGQGI
ncbi:MAG: tight adherence protein [Chloroflexota bacterium]|nr:tight adherence protein [Chloroflexota bacterium]